ncbi:MAG: ATP-binding protein, partial [Cyanobacteria bacterium J06635_15]
MNLPDLQTLWEFLQDNWNLLAGVATTLVAIATGTTALFRRYRQHRRRQLIAGIDAFPFEVLQPYSKNVLSRLLRESQVIARDLNEPLADFNIPYQTRRNNRNTRQELENALEETGWLLILGSAGLGKTREASELAKLLNNEGWTIFKYLEGEWLDIPASFPSDICDRRKLLFFIDNLHRITYRGRKREFAPGAENPSQPLKVPFQERLLDVLRYFEDECDSDQIRIIAISRNEIFPDSPDSPSNLEKLELDNFSQLWERFRQYTLPEPDDSAIIQLLTDTVPKAGIQSKPEDYPLIAQRNDNTFNNIIENLKTIRGRNWCLSADTFLETQHGTWY